MMQVKFSGRHLRGARVVSTRSTAPARTAGLVLKGPLPVHALRIGRIEREKRTGEPVARVQWV